MPNINVYIRIEDVEKFKALPNKSEFIHNALSGVGDSVIDVSKHDARYKSIKTPQPGIHGVSVVEVKDTFTPKPPDPETGYPCCTKAKPCKHWAFDGAEGVWRNELTGKTREVIQ